MSCLEELIRHKIEQGQAELLRAARAPITGLLVRNELPQTWAIITEQETLSIHADEAGNLTVYEGDTIVRDGAIAGKHDMIAEALRAGTKLPPNALVVTYYTTKGETAFKQLSGLFGL